LKKYFLELTDELDEPSPVIAAAFLDSDVSADLAVRSDLVEPGAKQHIELL
jgi:hypothetical protein